MKLMNKRLLRQILSEGRWDTEYPIDKLPKNLFVLPPNRSTNIILDGFIHTGIKVPKMKPITDVKKLKDLVKASRKRNLETIKNVDKIWGLDIGNGKYFLVCIDYKSMSGFKPKRLVLFLAKGMIKIADATAAFKIADQVEKYLKAHRKH